MLATDRTVIKLISRSRLNYESFTQVLLNIVCRI